MWLSPAQARRAQIGKIGGLEPRLNEHSRRLQGGYRREFAVAWRYACLLWGEVPRFCKVYDSRVFETGREAPVHIVVVVVDLRP